MQQQLFPISKLSLLTGIHPHTIRIWEKRYKLLSPHRTEGNTRGYDVDEVKYLLDICLLAHNGNRISKLALLDKNIISKEAKSLFDKDSRIRYTINQLIVAMHASDIDTFEDTLDNSVYEWGMAITVEKVILPFMYKVELFSYYSNRGEVHFVVTALRNKLIAAIDNIVLPQHAGLKALLYLPEGEHFDLMLLYLNYLLKGAGVKVLYMGTNVAEESLREVILQKCPDLLYSYVFLHQKSKGSSLDSFFKKEFPNLQSRVIEVGDSPESMFSSIVSK